MDRKCRNQTPRLCVVPGCEKPVYIAKHGLCSAHVTRFYRYGDPGGGRVGRKRMREPYRPLEPAVAG